MSPSSSRISRRITLSRVVVLPEKSMRRMKNCLPSSRRQREIHQIAVGNHVEGGLGDEIDVAELAVELAHVLDALAQLLGGEDVARGHAE